MAYDTRTKKFTLLADKCILRDKSIVSTIMSQMNLPSRSTHKGTVILSRAPRRPPPINLLHNLLCPADRVGDGAHRRRNPLPAVILRQLPCGKDAGGDQEHALATFVHWEVPGSGISRKSSLGHRIDT